MRYPSRHPSPRTLPGARPRHRTPRRTDYSDFLGLAEQTPTVRLDTAMVLTEPEYLGTYPRDLLPRLLDLDRRVVFGSDFPSIPHEFAAQVRGLARHTPDPAWLRAVLWDTPRNLFGLDAASIATPDDD